ncbi:hypothetical protein E2C01_064964 [Portunus trituberculatus]|uniref:Uncharacterized protein n=1 Tax=Portunus trituberculatus TaxID=210409 RepID=A0A5B7HEF6_PORTR|nr:hypothetical protein [Portunus trituberculatus]
MINVKAELSPSQGVPAPLVDTWITGRMPRTAPVRCTVAFGVLWSAQAQSRWVKYDVVERGW